MFFYRKCTKLIVSLIRVLKIKTTIIMKQREYKTRRKPERWGLARSLCQSNVKSVQLLLVLNYA